MSQINGDKARSAVHKHRRTLQRMKDRVRRAELQQAAATEKKDQKKPAETTGKS